MIQLDLDNIGRTQGNKFYLKGKLYEVRIDVTCEMIGDWLQDCIDNDLYLVYTAKGHRYIQDPFHMKYNRIVGNMLAVSDYPPPDKDLITEWEQRTGEVYTLYSLEGKDIDKDKGKDIIKVEKNKYAEFVAMTEEEYGKLCDEYGEINTKEAVKILDNYKGSKGKKYKSDYRAILSWVMKRVQSEVAPDQQMKESRKKTDIQTRKRELEKEMRQLEKIISGTTHPQRLKDFKSRLASVKKELASL